MSKDLRVVKPEGILDSVRALELRREVMDLIAAGATSILVDLQLVTFMNSSGMGALVATLKAVKAEGAELALCSLGDQVKIIFELSRMDRIFKVYRDRSECELALQT